MERTTGRRGPRRDRRAGDPAAPGVFVPTSASHSNQRRVRFGFEAEEFVQVFGAMPFADLVETSTQMFVSWWTDEEWLPEGAEVKTSATD